MADRVQRLKRSQFNMVPCENGDYVLYADIADLHASIIEQGRLVQIGASGDGPIGAMSAGEYIEWVATKLEESK